jgi:hypothetical protein
MRGIRWVDGFCPGGTVEFIVSPRDNLSSELSPGMSKRQRACPEQATARRMGRMLIPLSFLLLASNLNQDPFNRPTGTGLFPHDSRHFVPGSGVWTFTEGHFWKFAPRRGWRTQPRVSTLGTDQPTRRALKGRQIERPDKVEIGGPMAQL